MVQNDQLDEHSIDMLVVILKKAMDKIAKVIKEKKVIETIKAMDNFDKQQRQYHNNQRFNDFIGLGQHHARSGSRNKASNQACGQIVVKYRLRDYRHKRHAQRGYSYRNHCRDAEFLSESLICQYKQRHVQQIVYYAQVIDSRYLVHLKHIYEKHSEQHRHSGKTTAVKVHRSDYHVDADRKKKVAPDNEGHPVKHVFLVGCI